MNETKCGDARLVAAAPDLLEALERVNSLIKINHAPQTRNHAGEVEHDPTYCTKCIVEAALAKAKGNREMNETETKATKNIDTDMQLDLAF